MLCYSCVRAPFRDRGVKKDIHPNKNVRDIVVDAPAEAPPHKHSLRAYLEVLYLKLGEQHKPSMEISLKGKPVVPRDWAEYLVEQRQTYLLPKPNAKDVAAQFTGEGAARVGRQAASDAEATLTLGYPRSMRELVQILSAKAGADKAIAERKGAVKKHTGIFFYHQGRMTRALEPLYLQAKKTGSAQTTTTRILNMGMGLTGCVCENFLIQQHNKANYNDGRLFEAIMKDADATAKQYIVQCIRPAYGAVRGLLPHAEPPKKSPAAAQAPRKAPAKEKPAKAAELVEDTRMRPRDRLDEVVGRLVKVQGGPAGAGPPRYRLRTPDYALSERTYLAHELTQAFFDPAYDLAAGMLPAPAALSGCTVEVWWLPVDDETEGRFWKATLSEPPEEWTPRAGGREGWFSLVYPATDEDYGDAELVFVALKRGDPQTYTAFREDGEAMPGGVEFKIAPDALHGLQPTAGELEVVEVEAMEIGGGAGAAPGSTLRLRRELQEANEEYDKMKKIVRSVMREAANLDSSDLVAVESFKARAARYLRTVDKAEVQQPQQAQQAQQAAAPPQTKPQKRPRTSVAAQAAPAPAAPAPMALPPAQQAHLQRLVQLHQREQQQREQSHQLAELRGQLQRQAEGPPHVQQQPRMAPTPSSAFQRVEPGTSRLQAGQIIPASRPALRDAAVNEGRAAGVALNVTLSVTVPEGVSAGQAVQVQVPGGESAIVHVPAGLRAGDIFQTQVPSAVAQPPGAPPLPPPQPLPTSTPSQPAPSRPQPPALPAQEPEPGRLPIAPQLPEPAATPPTQLPEPARPAQEPLLPSQLPPPQPEPALPPPPQSEPQTTEREASEKTASEPEATGPPPPEPQRRQTPPKTQPAQPWWCVGQRVRAQFGATQDGPANRRFFLGKVTRVHADGSLDIKYDDGDAEERVLPKYVKLPPGAEGARPAVAEKVVCGIYGCVLDAWHQGPCVLPEMGGRKRQRVG